MKNLFVVIIFLIIGSCSLFDEKIDLICNGEISHFPDYSKKGKVAYQNTYHFIKKLNSNEDVGFEYEDGSDNNLIINEKFIKVDYKHEYKDSGFYWRIIKIDRYSGEIYHYRNMNGDTFTFTGTCEADKPKF